MTAHRPDAVIFCGDMANELSNVPKPRQVRRWSRAWGDLRYRVYPVPGNHDYEVTGALATWWAHAASRMGTAAQWFERRAFLLDLPAVSVFGVDCGPTGRRVDQAQLDWLTGRARVIEDDRVRWRIVALHGPLEPVSLHMNQPMLRASRQSLSRFASGIGADLLVCGHEHLYARTDIPAPSARCQVTVGGGGADLYPIVRTDLRSVASRRHILVLDVTNRHLEGRALGMDGECFDSWRWEH